jgi:hypothetical protein
MKRKRVNHNYHILREVMADALTDPTCPRKGRTRWVQAQYQRRTGINVGLVAIGNAMHTARQKGDLPNRQPTTIPNPTGPAKAEITSIAYCPHCGFALGRLIRLMEIAEQSGG